MRNATGTFIITTPRAMSESVAARGVTWVRALVLVVWFG